MVDRNEIDISSLEIRLFQEDDPISDLTGLINRAYSQLADLGLKYVGTWQGDDITRKRISSAECYIGLLNGKILATILFRDAATTRGSPWYNRDDVASFGQFCVESDLQGRGVGSAMISHTERRAIETGAAEIAFDTAEPAQHLIDWYSRRGYRFIEYVDWPVTNYRSVIMSKRLM